MAIYFKLATFVDRFSCYLDGKIGYASEESARAAAHKPGRYRVSRVNDDGTRTDLEPFDVAGKPGGRQRRKAYNPVATRPMSGLPH